MSNRFIDMASVGLRQHYDMEQAHSLATRLYNTHREKLAEHNEGITDKEADFAAGCYVVDQALGRMNEDTAWWDSEDPKVIAENQLERDFLFMYLPDLLVHVEAALGRPVIGEAGECSEEERLSYMGQNRDRLLAEVRGEEYVEPSINPLLAALFGGEIPPALLEQMEAGDEDCGDPEAHGEG